MHLQRNCAPALAERAGMSKQPMNQLLCRLEAYGYVERTDAPDEGRARTVHFTKGRAVHAKTIDILRDIEREWRAELGSADFAETQGNYSLASGIVHRRARSDASPDAVARSGHATSPSKPTPD
jgi:DNA-binding MarR family transcriptional regulator